MDKIEIENRQDRYLKILYKELERLNNKLKEKLEEKENGEKTRD